MDLDGVLAKLQLGRDLLVEFPADDLRGNLTLTRRELRISVRDSRQLGAACPGCLITIQGLPYGVQEVLVAEWLGQKLDGARFHGSYNHWDIAMGRNEDDGNRLPRTDQFALQIQPAQARHAHIEDQARRAVPVAPTQKFLRGSETLHIQRN